MLYIYIEHNESLCYMFCMRKNTQGEYWLLGYTALFHWNWSNTHDYAGIYKHTTQHITGSYW